MFRIERRDSTSIVHITEDLDIASKGRLIDAIATAEGTKPSRIVVSLERCEYCDSTALAELVKAQRRNGLKFQLVVPPKARCARIFELTGLTAILRVNPSLEAALANGVAID